MTAIAIKPTGREQQWQDFFTALLELGEDLTKGLKNKDHIRHIPLQTPESGMIIAHLAKFLKETSNELLKRYAADKLRDFVRAGDDPNQTALNALIACKDDTTTPIVRTLLYCYSQIILANKDPNKKAMRALAALKDSPHTTPVSVFESCIGIYRDGTDPQAQAAGQILLDIAKTAKSGFGEIKERCWNAYNFGGIAGDKDRHHVILKVFAELARKDPGEHKLGLVGIYRVILGDGKDHENIILKSLVELSKIDDSEVRSSAAEECLTVALSDKDHNGIALEAFRQALCDQENGPELAEKAVRQLNKNPGENAAIRNLTTAFGQAGTNPACPEETRSIIHQYLTQRPKDTKVNDLATTLGLHKE